MQAFRVLQTDVDWIQTCIQLHKRTLLSEALNYLYVMNASCQLQFSLELCFLYLHNNMLSDVEVLPTPEVSAMAPCQMYVRVYTVWSWTHALKSTSCRHECKICGCGCHDVCICSCTSLMVTLICAPMSSNRQYLSCDDCLEDKRIGYQK